jgi:hypothetical protein
LRASDPSAAYEQISADIFALSTHEYNAGVGQAAPDCLPTPQPAESDMPPGLLACRRVSYELEMRGERIDRTKEKASKDKRRQDDQSWRKAILEKVPSELSRCNVSELKSFLAFLVWMRALAPDYESELWVSKFICLFRDQIGACTSEQGLHLHHPPWTG